MVKKALKILWDNEAKKQLQQLHNYIRKNSPQNALQVRNDIVQAVKKLILNPEKFPPDKYKTENDGTYRAFEIHRYRIAYFVSTDEIRILRIRHTSMEPKNY